MKRSSAICQALLWMTVALASAALSSADGATNILSEGFEGDFPGIWTTGDSNPAGTDSYWNGVDTTFGSVPARSGGRKGYCAGTGYAGSKPSPLYQADMFAFMRTSLNLLSACDATLTFWYRVPSIDSCCDSFQVKVGGTTLFSNSQPALAWTQVSLGLGSFVGQVVDLEFVFASDASGQYEGVYLDDIVVTAEPAMAAISNAWWGPAQDHDDDGCFASPGDTFQLFWTSQVSCATPLSVYEKIYRRRSGYTTWNLLVTTSPHTITASGDNQMSTNVPAGSFCSDRDYRIEIYRAGAAAPDDTRDATNDPDLAHHREELFSEDECLATIWNAWWGPLQDDDADGCMAAPNDLMRLYWDPDVANCGGTLTVYERLSRRPTGTTNWVDWITTVPHVITGDSSADFQFVEFASGLDCAGTDFKIEVYRLGQTLPDYTRDPANDAELFNHREEPFSQDDCGIAITDAWWVFQQDADADGCFATSSNSFRLAWASEIQNTNCSPQVFEKVYRQSCDSPLWSCLATTLVHTITVGGTGELQYVDVPANSLCACFNYKIEIYQAGRDLPDFIRGPGNDVDLAGHQEELFIEDDCAFSRVVIADAWWSDCIDTDGDGCWEPLGWTGGRATQRLNWNSDLTPCHGTVSVYENVYRRLSGQTSWQLWATTAPHNITGQSSADQQSVEIATGVSCEAYDYKIELFRTGETTPEYVRDPSNDPDLAGRSEEALQRPLLSILRVPQENVVLSWPSNFAAFRLECITDLRTQSWVTCLPAATLVGTEWMVTNRLETNRYYRLAQP